MARPDTLEFDKESSLVGRVIQDRYRIVRKIGTGGMGAVYEGEHLLIKKRVAIKCLHERIGDDAKLLKRFQNEAIAATSIGHPNIVDVIDFGHFGDGTAFMVLEYLEGCDYENLIAREGPQPIGRTARIVSQVCDALRAAHARGIVHRDLKPENLFLVEREDNPYFVKVLDFGIAKFTEADELRLTQTGQAMGTPYYMAPEQLLGSTSIDARTDLYALGVILFHALTNEFPFESEVFARLVLSVTQSPAPRVSSVRGDVPASLCALVDRLLQKDPQKRPASVTEVREALREFRELDAAPPAVKTDRGSGRLASGVETLSPITAPIGEMSAPAAHEALAHAQTLAPHESDSFSSSGAPVKIRVSSPPSTPSSLEPPMASGAAIAITSEAKRSEGSRSPGGSGGVSPPEIIALPMRPRAAWIIGALALSAIGVAAFFVLRPPSEAPRATDAGVHVSIATDPPSAQLLLDGEPVSNPFDGSIVPSERHHRIEARLEGYEPVVRELSLRIPQHIPIVLRPATPAPRAELVRPAPAPAVEPPRRRRREPAAHASAEPTVPPAPDPPPPAADPPREPPDLLDVRLRRP